VLGRCQIQEIIYDVLVVGLQEFKGFWHACHGGCGGFNDGGQLGECELRIFLIIADHASHQSIYTFLELFILEALN
jgi:hypothetical protein